MSKTKTLIALVATAVMVAGERVVVQAGEPLPEPIKPRDREEMLTSKVAAESADAPQAQAAQASTEPQAPAAAEPPAPAPAKPSASEPPSRPKKR